MTSMEIFQVQYYHLDRKNPFRFKNPEGMDCGTYYNTLTEAVVKETEQMSVSALVCHLLCKEGERLQVDYLTYQALLEAERRLSGQSPHKIEEDDEKVPGTDIFFAQICKQNMVSEMKKSFLQKLSRLPSQEHLEQQKVEHSFYQSYAEMVEQCRQDAEKLRDKMAARLLEQHLFASQQEEQEEQKRKTQNGQQLKKQKDFLTKVSSESSELQKAVMQQLNQTGQQVLDAISGWKRDMFGMNLRPLAECYSQLYVLTQKAYMPAGKSIAKNTEDAVELQHMYVSMKRLCHDMENAMKLLGIAVCIPMVGESMNEEQHCTDADILPAHARISRCISPVVRYWDDVLVKAEVTVTEGEN